MKKSILLFTAFTLMAFAISYKDGNYHGSSRAQYTSEPYFGFTKIAVEKGKIVNVEFYIRDSSKHVNFDGEYEKYFAGNNLYINQSRNDWKGVKSYPDSLLKYQDIQKVDVISGATWSYNIFKASAAEALSLAEK